MPPLTRILGAAADWLREGRESTEVQQRRRRTHRYRRKRSLVRGLWLATAGLMLVRPEPAVVAGLGLLATFLSFAILDDTP